jgi:hypothetical protein
MQAIVGTMLDAVEGSWNGVAEKTGEEVLTLARSLAELPALHSKTGGMTGATGWLSLASHHNCLCVYFDGSNLAQFEWKPSFDEAAQPIDGFCDVQICLEAIKALELDPSRTHLLFTLHAVAEESDVMGE